MSKKIYFLTGSQDLYGEDVLKQVGKDSQAIVAFLNDHIKTAEIIWTPTVRNSDEILDVCQKASIDDSCVGVITWMHTFSPSKMWIAGLKVLQKPLLHLHTQFNRDIPFNEIDMNFMNLNQSAHGDREFGFICTRLGLEREVVVGHYQSKQVINKIKTFIDVVKAIHFAHHLKVVMFGSNMRQVAVTDGDRVESQIKYGWQTNYYGIGDLVDEINKVTTKESDDKYHEYINQYELATDQIDAVKEQAKYEVALEKFLKKEKAYAFTDTFEDLHGLKQLPGLAVQNLMAKGVGFGPEGDYKTSALMAVMCEMAKSREGATAFIENYTYHLEPGNELELASHMLEVSPVFADRKPTIEVHPLGIGGKADPARLVFDGISGEAISVSMIDMGDHFRLICAAVELVNPTHKFPKLPVARVMWKVKPNFEDGVSRWIYAGGAHHAVVSTALTIADMKLFAKLTKTELMIIN